MRKSPLLLSLFLVLLLVLSGCNNSQNDQASESRETEAIAEDTQDNKLSMENTESSKQETAEEKTTKNNSEIDTTSETNRMVIYNANISLIVKNYQEVENAIEKKATNLGGYVVESSIYNNGSDSISGNLIVKVPQKSFQSFLNDVEETGIKLTEKTISGNDVTEEYVDLESRLKAKNAVEKRLLTLMEQAEKTEDLLKISEDLATVQEEKEQIMGRMNYLQKNVDYSTVTINLEEELVEIGTINKQESLNTWEKAKKLFVDTVNGMLSFFSSIIIFLIGLSPVLIAIAVVLSIWIILRRRKKQKD